LEAKFTASLAGKKVSNTFFYCAYTKFLWCAIHLVFYLTSSKDIDDLFDQWLKQEGHKSNYTY